MDNCHGCKYLDELKSCKGSGYCCHVVAAPEYCKGMKVRYPDKPRCSLYTPGDFKTRYRKELNT